MNSPFTEFFVKLCISVYWPSFILLLWPPTLISYSQVNCYSNLPVHVPCFRLLEHFLLRSIGSKPRRKVRPEAHSFPLFVGGSAPSSHRPSRAPLVNSDIIFQKVNQLRADNTQLRWSNEMAEERWEPSKVREDRTRQRRKPAVEEGDKWS